MVKIFQLHRKNEKESVSTFKTKTFGMQISLGSLLLSRIWQSCSSSVDLCSCLNLLLICIWSGYVIIKYRLSLGLSLMSTEIYTKRKKIFWGIQNTLCNSLLNVNIIVIWLIKKHENLIVYPHELHKWTNLLLCVFTLRKLR